VSDIQQQVQETVADLVGSGTERGLQVAVYRDGEQVVDAVAGTDAAGRALAPDTPVHAMSAGKGVLATVVHVLAERGALDYDTRIAELWPEFGAHGKDSATLRQALTHSVGVPALPDGVTLDMMCDWDAMCAAIAASQPAWEPGTQTGYHAQTWGFIVGEVVRRATGRPISQVLRDEVAGPIGVADELYFGVPAADLDRVARLEEAPGYSETLMAMFGSPVPPTIDFLNNRTALASDIPNGGIMSARAVARLYAALLSQVDGVRLVPDERLRELSAVAYQGPDVVVGMPTMLALGYGIGRPGAEDPQATPTVFGMPGMGGSAAYADTATGTAFAITTTRLHMGVAPGLDRVGNLVARAFA
jgi:CubicO group peptidase (beta-lactamase class C family)